MGFAGELTTIGLPEVFQNVSFNRLTGVLTVSERGRRAAVYLEQGMIRAFKPGADRSIDYVATAERCNAATPEALRQAAKRRRRRTLKEALRTGGGLDEDRFDAAVQSTIKEEIILLFAWRDASFVFEEVRPENGFFDREQLECAIALDPQVVVVEAARRVDEWETIAHQVDSERDIFLPKEPLVDGEATPVMREIVALLDGTRDLRQIIEEMPYSRFEVLRTVAGLAESAHIGKASAAELCALAREAEEAREINRSVRFLEAALEMEQNNLEARHELVRLYERSGRRSEAANEYKRLARYQEEQGDLDGALESYGKAAALVPYEADALERIVDIHDARGDKKEFMRAGLRLAEALSTQALLEEALEVYKRLLQQDEESVVLRESIAATYIKLHESKMAARELLVLARRAWDKQDYDRSLHYYRNVLAVDRDCEEAAQRIEDIEGKRLRERRRGARRRITFMLLSLCIGLGLLQATREWFAQEALHEAARLTLTSIPHREMDDALIGAVDAYAHVSREFPYTVGGLKAEEAVRALLLNQLERIRVAAARDPDEAERQLRSLGKVEWPDRLRPLWRDARDQLLEFVAKQRG